jgi:phospholipid transport system substrate-binding protein
MHPALIFIVASLATAAESATDVLKARDVQIRKTLPASGELTTAERSKLQDAVMKIVDTEAMAKASLGKTWESESKAEQKRFMKVFDSRLRQAITQEVDFFNSSQIDYQAEKQVADGTEVPTQMTVKGDATEVDYVLKQISGGWRIVDIVIDGVSTTQNYRSSFGKVIAKEGWDGLIARLSKGKAEKTAAEPKGTP